MNSENLINYLDICKNSLEDLNSLVSFLFSCELQLSSKTFEKMNFALNHYLLMHENDLTISEIQTLIKLTIFLNVNFQIFKPRTGSICFSSIFDLLLSAMIKKFSDDDCSLENLAYFNMIYDFGIFISLSNSSKELDKLKKISGELYRLLKSRAKNNVAQLCMTKFLYVDCYTGNFQKEQRNPMPKAPEQNSYMLLPNNNRKPEHKPEHKPEPKQDKIPDIKANSFQFSEEFFDSIIRKDNNFQEENLNNLITNYTQEKEKKYQNFMADFSWSKMDRDITNYLNGNFGGVLGAKRLKLLTNDSIDIVILNKDSKNKISDLPQFKAMILSMSQRSSEYSLTQVSENEESPVITYIYFSKKNEFSCVLNFYLYNKQYKLSTNLLVSYFQSINYLKEIFWFFYKILQEECSLIISDSDLQILLLNALDKKFSIFSSKKEDWSFSKYSVEKGRLVRKELTKVYSFALDKENLVELNSQNKIYIITQCCQFLYAYFSYAINRSIFDDKFQNTIFTDPQFIFNRIHIDSFYEKVVKEEYSEKLRKLLKVLNELQEKIFPNIIQILKKEEK